MISFIKSNKLITIIFILIFIFLLIIGKFNYFYWIADGVLAFILFSIFISTKHKEHAQESNLPENMNYLRIFLKMPKHDEKKLGKTRKSITYMYINKSSKIITFPETKYYLNRKYHLINLSPFNNSKVILTLSIINESINNIHIQIGNIAPKDIDLLKQLLK